MTSTNTLRLDDVYLPEFILRRSANAWWMRDGKLLLLIAGFKMGYSIKTSCELAGISLDQYHYFLKLHPDFSYVKQRCKDFIGIRIHEALYKAIESGDLPTLRWYAEKRLDEFKG